MIHCIYIIKNFFLSSSPVYAKLESIVAATLYDGWVAGLALLGVHTHILFVRHGGFNTLGYLAVLHFLVPRDRCRSRKCIGYHNGILIVLVSRIGFSVILRTELF